MEKKTPEVRFARFIDKGAADKCWPWKGYIRPNGYGRFMRAAGEPVYAHRMAYEIANGEIPDGKSVDHLCRNRSCCNPAHLEAVSQHENLHRSSITRTAINAAKTQCPRGHPHEPYRVGEVRDCTTCRKDRRRQANQSLQPRA